MDLRMPGTNGIDATRRILARMPCVGILVVTMYEDDVSVFAAMRAGARGYLLKDADQSDLLRAVHAVYRGEAIFSPAIAQRLMKYFGALHAAAPDSLAFPELTAREREILMIAECRNNDAITIQLGLNMKTVQNHISSIFGKLQVADRARRSSTQETQVSERPRRPPGIATAPPGPKRHPETCYARSSLSVYLGR